MTSISRSRIPLFLFILWGSVSLSGVEIVPDLRKIEPLALVTGGNAVAAVRGKVLGAPGRRPSGFPVFFHLMSEEGGFPEKVAALGGRATRVHPRLYSGEIPGDAARYISRWPEVAYIEAAKRARPMLNLSRPAVFADVVQNGTGLPAAFTGSGTYVGIVDSGMSSGHLDFFVNGNPSSPRVVHWYPDPGTAGTDTEWHGTHVAGIAAGNGFLSGGLYTGIAPGASLLVAKTTFTTVDIQNAVNDLLIFAGTTPVAINLSLGLVTGPHDGTSGFENGIGFLATNGVSSGGKQIISAAAGNERTDKEHFQVTLPPFGSVNAPLSLETDGSFIDVWADGADRYTVTATLGSESASAPTGSSASASSGRISVSNRTDAPPNGATHVTVFFRAPAVSPATILLERTRNGGNGKMDAYIDQSDGVFTTATEAGTISEPANADDVIAVGSFNTKLGGGAGQVGDISSFSSLGPTRDGRDKPDLAAPGFIIYAAKSLDLYLDPPPEPQTVPGDNNYAVLAGTSMSAPHVAGIASLVWQSNPLFTSAQMRERLRRTATPVPPTPNATWGYGKANALAAVSASVASINAPATAVPGTPVPLTSGNSSGPFGAPITNYQWAASGASVSPPNNASATFQANAPGDYTVSLTITAGGVTSLPASKIIHVNNIPLSFISGPSSDNVGIPVSFSGAGSTDIDPDGQPLTLRWVLVSRPAGSSATLLPTGSDNSSLTSDVAGTYEVGLRADDGLDNSALVTKILTATGTAPPQAGGDGGGGGGCSMGTAKGEDDGSSSLAALLPLLLPLGVLSARKRGYRFLRRRRPAATKCR